MEGNNSCSGDDLACWPRAQVNLLHTVANASGCTVLLVGDFHYSDLKVIQPGGDQQYAGALQTGRLSKPVYQVRLAAAATPAAALLEIWSSASAVWLSPAVLHACCDCLDGG